MPPHHEGAAEQIVEVRTSVLSLEHLLTVAVMRLNGYIWPIRPSKPVLLLFLNHQTSPRVPYMLVNAVARPLYLNVFN